MASGLTPASAPIRIHTLYICPPGNRRVSVRTASSTELAIPISCISRFLATARRTVDRRRAKFLTRRAGELSWDGNSQQGRPSVRFVPGEVRAAPQERLRRPVAQRSREAFLRSRRTRDRAPGSRTLPGRLPGKVWRGLGVQC